MDHRLFLTGRLAEPALRRVLEELGELPFTWEVREIGVQVAALMTADLIRRRVPAPLQASAPVTQILVPGRCQGDLAALSAHYGVPVVRGPEDLKDLPTYFQRAQRPVDLSAYRTRIFAEIVDAPRLTVAEVLPRAAALAADGADVIDLGSLPDTPFPQLVDCVRALKAAGHAVSVDSLQPDELLAGAHAGADFLLSLPPRLLGLVDELPPGCTPVLIGAEPGDEAGLHASVRELQRRGRPFLADPILDPLPFGLARSIVRYQRLRDAFPDAPILMGVGNVTELTEADTSGINALLLGLAAELNVAAILTTQVSPHARRAVREADLARRVMHAAAQQRRLPKGLADGLMTVHARRPWPDSAEEIAATAAQVRDPNFRIQVAEAGLYVYNRDGLRHATDPFVLWPQLGLGRNAGSAGSADDAGHAFYLGVELARAEIAWQLGKRYVQDQPLDWGVAAAHAPRAADGTCGPRPPSPTPPTPSPSTRTRRGPRKTEA